METITLSGEAKSTQSIYRSVCMGNHPRTYMTHDGKALKEQYQWEAKSQYHKPVITAPVAVTIRFYFGTKRTRDLDNQNKLILDALSGIVYKDDKQIQELHLYKDYNKAKPRIEVSIIELFRGGI